MSSYQTKQRSMILSLLSDNEDKRMTADEIVSALGDCSPGKSTVYRLVKKLEEEGVVCRFTREGTSRAEYQIRGARCCREHLHIKCTDCGLVLHLDRRAQDSISAGTGFVIDDVRSMLYGKCAVCAGRAK